MSTPFYRIIQMRLTVSFNIGGGQRSSDHLWQIIISLTYSGDGKKSDTSLLARSVESEAKNAFPETGEI